ncbi:MAG: DUF1559 domain-containing protein, partial [Victivallales bacterium]|nr:DUF1559 domain-containing protein [Victivallales bacterium]
GDSVDFRSDMYCVGLVFYQLLAGAPLFQGRAKMEILRAQVSESHSPIKTVNPDVTDACSQVLDKLLSKNPDDRYKSWSEVIAALDAVIHPNAAVGASSSGDMTTSRYKMQAISMPAAGAAKQTESSEKPVESKPKTPIAVLIAVLLVALIGIGVFTRLRKQSEESASSDASAPSLLEQPSSVVPDAKVDETRKKVESQVPAVAETAEKKPVEAVSEPAKVVETPKQVKPALGIEKTDPVDSAKEERNRRACQNNLKQIGVVLLMYANVFKTKFPEKNGAAGLEELRKNGFVELPQIFVCPSTGHVAAAPKTPITEETCDYVYVGGLSSEYSDPKTPLAWSKPGNHKDFGCVLYVNGDVECFSGSNWLVHTKPPKKK